jgi:LmbE family N-acetylglucosaminyl deacetylase
MAAPKSTRAVDITDTIDRKIAALLCHRTQIDDGDRIDELIRSWGKRTAEEQGLAAGRLAEAFKVVDTR